MRPSRSGKTECIFGGIRRCLSSSCAHRACCEPVLREQAGFRFGVLLVLISSFSFSRSLDFLLTVMEGGGFFSVRTSEFAEEGLQIFF